MAERISGEITIELYCNGCGATIEIEDIDVSGMMYDSIEDHIKRMYIKNGSNPMDEISSCKNCK